MTQLDGSSPGHVPERETTMSTTRILATSIAWVLISAPVTSAQDLSKYREFQLGTSLVAVAHQAGMAPEPRVLQQRPALIQELMWQPSPMRGSSPQGDSVKKVLFSFYNGQLFRIIVSYDRERTAGLTGVDMAEAISAKYGLAMLPATQLMPLLAPVSAGTDILARWGDSQVLGPPLPILLPGHVWAGDVFKAAGCPGARGDRGSGTARRARGAAARTRPSTETD